MISSPTNVRATEYEVERFIQKANRATAISFACVIHCHEGDEGKGSSTTGHPHACSESTGDQVVGSGTR